VTTPDPDAHTRELAAAALANDDPTSWFEILYTEASAGTAVVPWDTGTPHAMVAGWVQGRSGAGRKALVVGCGLGRDAELIASLGYTTTAFDISETAVRTTMARYPDSTVTYVAADLLNPPADWHQGFDLVVESLTVQAMPLSLRAAATREVSRFVAPGGTLVVVAASRPDDGPVDGPPWPLSRAEVDAFAVGGVTAVKIEAVPGAEAGSRPRWLAEFRR
jgi:SAM-dependent methyltransferase